MAGRSGGVRWAWQTGLAGAGLDIQHGWLSLVATPTVWCPVVLLYGEDCEHNKVERHVVFSEVPIQSETLKPVLLCGSVGNHLLGQQRSLLVFLCRGLW